MPKLASQKQNNKQQTVSSYLEEIKKDLTKQTLSTKSSSMSSKTKKLDLSQVIGKINSLVYAIEQASQRKGNDLLVQEKNKRLFLEIMNPKAGQEQKQAQKQEAKTQKAQPSQASKPQAKAQPQVTRTQKAQPSQACKPQAKTQQKQVIIKKATTAKQPVKAQQKSKATKAQGKKK